MTARTRLIQSLPGSASASPLWTTASGRLLLDDYLAAEALLRDWTDRNVGRLCAICARWTAFVAAASTDSTRLQWGLGSWVTSCCNANHAREAMTSESLAGVTATATYGDDWVQRAPKAANAPCDALTESGCALTSGRPELCNRYFCEGVRDYFWLLGGEELAQCLAGLQQTWAHLYRDYGSLLLAPAPAAAQPARSASWQLPWPRREQRTDEQREQLRQQAGWYTLRQLIGEFDATIAAGVRQITVDELAHRLFKVSGDETVWRPFLEAELAAIRGRIRRPDQPAEE